MQDTFTIYDHIVIFRFIAVSYKIMIDSYTKMYYYNICGVVDMWQVREVLHMDGLKNVMEAVVERQINKLLPTMPNVCACEKCRLDMAAFALNRLRPQYVRTDTGALYQKLNNSSQQAEVEVLTSVMSAINIISAHPKH